MHCVCPPFSSSFSRWVRATVGVQQLLRLVMPSHSHLHQHALQVCTIRIFYCANIPRRTLLFLAAIRVPTSKHTMCAASAPQPEPTASDSSSVDCHALLSQVRRTIIASEPKFKTRRATGNAKRFTSGASIGSAAAANRHGAPRLFCATRQRNHRHGRGELLLGAAISVAARIRRVWLSLP